MYRNQKQVYLNSVTDSKKRRTLRAYFGGKIECPSAELYEQLVNRELSKRLKKQGIKLDKSELDNYLENWRQTMLKLIQENSLQAQKIIELEKKLENIKNRKN